MNLVEQPSTTWDASAMVYMKSRFDSVTLDYTVELIMEYSNLPDFGSFPLQNGMEEPRYEGFSLPGFPMHLQVAEWLLEG